MTEQQKEPTTSDLRRAATAVFLVADEIPAKDISAKLLWAAEKIDALEKEKTTP